MTVLHKAVVNGHTDCVKLLLSKNAEIEVRDNELRSPLHLAAYNGDKDVSKAYHDQRIQTIFAWMNAHDLPLLLLTSCRLPHCWSKKGPKWDAEIEKEGLHCIMQAIMAIKTLHSSWSRKEVISIVKTKEGGWLCMVECPIFPRPNIYISWLSIFFFAALRSTITTLATWNFLACTDRTWGGLVIIL